MSGATFGWPRLSWWRSMGDKPPFDPVKASFYLIASILAVQCGVVFIGLLHCLYWSQHIVEGKYSCENVNSALGQLLTGALSAALAFTAGFTRRDK